MSSYEGLCPDCQQVECDEACMKATSNVKLLPLPEPKMDAAEGGLDWTDDEMTDYARANVEANTEALRTERDAYKSKYHRAVDDLSAVSEQAEALRAEVAKQSSYAKRTHDWNTELLANNERLAEALRELVDLKDNVKHSFPNDYAARKPLAWDKARALLRDQENGRD